MSVLVVGMSHRSAPVDVLEKLSMDPDLRSEAATTLLESPTISESFIVSTCNRLEVYTEVTGFHSGIQDVVMLLHRISGIPPEEMREYLYVRYADSAAEHLLTVASGMDSMVTGEQQIIGQVRSAYRDAKELKTVGRGLHELVQAALHTGKRVHSETSIDDAGASMVTLALTEAAERLGTESAPLPLQGRSVLILGAGAMASLAASHVGRMGVEKLIIANRTRDNAERLAQHSLEAGVSAEVIDYAERANVLERCDIVISATGADSHTLSAEDFTDAQHPAHVVIDLSLPRDIDPDIAQLDGIDLINIEALAARGESTGEAGGSAIDEARAIINAELDHYTAAQRVRDVVPAVTALHRRASELVTDELARLRSRAPQMDDADFERSAAAMRRVVDKLLHEPTVRIKQLAQDSAVVSYETALQDLFGLEGAPVTARNVSATASSLPAGDFRIDSEEPTTNDERHQETA